jgi:hypothetical protein
MNEPLRCAFIVVLPSPGWRLTHAVHGGLTLQSPRDHGTLHFSTVPMPEELGSYDVEKLWDRARPKGPTAFLHKGRFDEASWADGIVEGIAFSNVHEFDGIELPADLELPAEIVQEAAAKLIRRDWSLAKAGLVVDVMYSCRDLPEIVISPDDRFEVRRGLSVVAADLFDCEEMVRSIQFDS